MAPAQIVQKTSEKRRNESVIQQEIDDGLNLFVDAPPDEDEDKFSISIKNDDSSDSESSVYSELENEDSGEDSSSEVAISESEDEDEDDDSSKKEIGELSVTEESITPISKALINEYEYDSSDEEDLRNTIGNIPVEWYNDYPHIGYDWDGTKIMKPATKDELDKFLNKMEDPNYWRTVHDKQTGKDVVLSDEDLEIIQKIQTGSYPSKEFNPFKPWVDLYSHEVEIHPMTNRPEHKRSFYPSKIEKQKVSKILHAIKMGWIQPKKQKEEPRFYPLWDDDNDKNEISKRMLHHIPAPKMKLPGHEESYNPPPEYLFTKEEEKEWLSREPEERKLDFIPKKYSRLLDVPSYPQFIKERFERCLDLYLCPRQQKMRMNVDPEDLIPKLPKPKDLQPFPTTLSIIYKGHEGLIRCLTVESLGQFLATGSDDNTIKVWEIATGRCLKTINVDGSVTSLAWCPNNNICLIAAAVNNDVLIINPEVGDKLIVSNTDEALTTPIEKDKAEKKPSIIQWNLAEDGKQHGGIRLILSHPKPLKQVTWHARGDYFASVMDDAGNTAVQIHQLTKRRTQQPFTRTKGLVQCVCFHPTKPYFFVATQRYVRIYNLLKQELTKKLMTNSKWVSSMAIHPAGDNIIIGGYDSRLSWFDLDLSSKPYQTLRHHKQAIRQVAFHRRYPLFASASDDCSVIVCHGMVYNDLLQNPLIVPVKVLKGHTKKDDLGVIDCIFHPNQPWIFSAGADGTARLYT